MINYFELILVLIIVGLGVWVWKLEQDKKESDREVAIMEKEKDEYAEIGKGLAEYNQKLQDKKDAAKNRIVELISKKKKISSRDIADDLGISSRTAVRYLDELEKEGKARQVGKVGQSVFYTKK